jgi:hypothetical protein
MPQDNQNDLARPNAKLMKECGVARGMITEISPRNVGFFAALDEVAKRVIVRGRIRQKRR